MRHVIRNSMLLLCAAPFAALTMGCGTAAIISRPMEPTVEGTIVSAEDDMLQVATPAGNHSIPLRNVTDIDHPGNVAATIGTLVTAYGVANIAIGAEDCDRGGPAYCFGVFLPAAIGLPIMIWGFTTWGKSKSASSPQSQHKDVSFSVVPAASLQKNNTFVGANATVTF
jgi:hypothetical protein